MRLCRMSGRGMMAVAQMPGCATYKVGVFWLAGAGESRGGRDNRVGDRKRETKGLVDGSCEVSARTSVSRLEDSYARVA